jgi:predicted acyltransferase
LFVITIFSPLTKTMPLNQRFYSLDIFRGATVALMILVNNPGSWSHIYAPLEHAPWHGCTPTDLVFPFFLFAVGNALAFVLPRLEQAGTSAVLQKVVRRTLLIFAIGLFLNWSPFIKWQDGALVFKHWVDPANPETGIRILGVLQRIALSYFFASLIVYFFKIRGAVVISILLLVGYWGLCFVLDNPMERYSLVGYFGTRLDMAILHIPHMYKGEGVPFDPEGLASTLTAIVQVICGYFVGYYIRQKGKTWEMLSTLFVAGAVLIVGGLIWDLVFPINKKIWTSSYVLYTTGLATSILGILIYLVELKKLHEQKSRFSSSGIYILAAVVNVALILFTWLVLKRPFISVLFAFPIATFFIFVFAGNHFSKFFDVFGKNALFIFFLSGFLPRILGLLRWTDHVSADGKKVYTSAFAWFNQTICEPVSENLKIGSLMYALCMILFYWVIVYWLDKKKIYIKV